VSAPALHLHLRLFLEGIEVPVISAGVTTQIGSAATANIQVVPDDTLLEILPRTVVHLFVLDSIEFEVGGESTARDGNFKLLFCGEVAGIQFSKAGAGSRSASLSCIDFSNVWDTNYAFSLNFSGSDGLPFEDRSAFLGISQPSFDNIINTPATLVRLIAEQSPQTAGLQGTQSILGNLFSVLEALSGVQGVFMGVGPWPTIHERRTRVLDSIMSDSGETAKALYSAATFSEWLQNRNGAVGAVSSFRDTINMILGFIFYQFVPNPAPKYIRGSDASGKYPGRDIPVSATRALRVKILAEFDAKTGLVTNPAKLDNLNLEFLEKMVALMTRFTARVGEPLQYEGVDTGFTFEFRINDGWREAKDGEPGTAHERGFAMDFGHPDFSGKLFGGRMPYKLEGGIEPIKLTEVGGVKGPVHAKFRYIMYDYGLKGTTIQTLEELKGVASLGRYNPLWDAENTVEKALTMLKALSAWAAIVLNEVSKDKELVYGGDINPSNWNMRADPLFALVKVANDPVHVQDRNHKRKFAGQTAKNAAIPDGPEKVRERLNSFLFRPDIWFAAPPRCNVIYPDQVTSFDMQRSMLRETTRLQINVALDQTIDASNSAQLDRLSFAPKIPGKEQLAQRGLGAADRVIIHNHEVYSGVIPKFERVSDMLYYRLKTPGIAESRTGLQAESRFQVFADRLAHFHLLSNRYLARTASVSSTFNLNLVCGFPAVIIDAPLSEFELAEVDRGRRSDRAHWLGMISSVSHSITQGGAQTSVSLTHVRSHRTGDRTDDLFAEGIDSDGFLSIQNQEESLRAYGVFSVEAGTQITVLRDGTERARYADLTLEADPTQLFFWEALKQLMGVDVISYAARTFLLRLEGTTITPQLAVSYVSTDFSAKVGAGQLVAISEVPSPGGGTTKGVVWEGPPITVVIRLRGGVGAEDPIWRGAVASLEMAKAEYSLTIGAETLAALVASKTSYLFMDKPLGEATVLEYFVTLPGSTLSIEGAAVTPRMGLPIEESLRPSWISADYSTERETTTSLTKISEKVYLPFFGSQCIVDSVLSEKPPEGLARQSVEQAVDRLVRDYSRSVSQGGRHTLRHIHGVTHRKVATLTQVLGSKHGYLTKEGGFQTERRPAGGFKDNKYALYGGFHSNAVNFGLKDYGSGLEFLDLKDVGLRGRYGGVDLVKTITDDLDPRAERSRRVAQYNGQIRGTAALQHVSPAASSPHSSQDATVQHTPTGIAKRG
jgi:hypothetical protein